MDKKQLATIATTALVTWSVTKFAGWLLEVAKTKATSDSTKARLRTVFNKNNRAILGDSAWIIVCLFFLITTMRGSSPVTRGVVLNIVIYTLGTIAFGVFLVADIVILKTRSRMSQISEALRHINESLEKAKGPIPLPDNEIKN